MIKENKILKICAIAVCALLYNSSIAFSEQVVTNTQTVNGGNVSRETQTGYASGGGSGGGASSSSRLSDEEIASREADEERESMEDARDVNYSNLYNGRPLLPEAMMIYCKVNAEDIAADLTKIEECIKKYIKAINNDNSAVKAQGLHEYDVMRYQALNDTLTSATNKLKSIIDFENTANSYASATNDSNTQRDTEAAIANSQVFSTNVINHLRDLYAENLKLLALEGIRNIDPSAILTEEEYQESKTAVKSSATTESDNKSISSETTITPDDSGNGTGTGSGTGADTGADTGNNAGGQSGENNSNGENATASNSASLQEINNRVNELSNMNAEEIARHGYEIDNLRTEAANVMNDPNATPSEREAARRTISNINRLNEKVSDASRNNGSGGNSSTGGNNNSGGNSSTGSENNSNRNENNSNGVDNEAGARNNDNNNNSVTQPEQNNTNDTDAYDIMIEADRYNSLDTEDLIQHKSEIDSLLDQARRMENDPSIEPDDREAARKAREDLESLSLEIEEETKANQ